ncbi:hypothetical protein B0H19DRAFT_1383655 [Mycena capillaripes]|nr:hypothetical protein B0H19DRAFT_1383655 [Mycena capillaripes]
MARTPFNVPELVDQCINFLGGSKCALQACALVSRSWVYPAQTLLFREFRLTVRGSTTKVWARLRASLKSSPHLIRHVRSLDLELGETEIATLGQICNFQFTHLDRICVVHLGYLALQSAQALQQLLGRPTLRRVELRCMFLDPAHFMQIWSDCSPSIRHVDMRCLSVRPHFSIVPYPGTPIRLESLHMGSEGSLDSRLLQESRLFDPSHLTTLSFDSKINVNWQELTPHVRTVKTLIFEATDPRAPLDLSLLPSLTVMRIYIPSARSRMLSLQTLHETLSGLPPSSDIHKIVIVPEVAKPGSTICEQIDRILSTLPVDPLPMVELEMRRKHYDSVVSYFPRLTSKNLLHRVDCLSEW